MKTKTVLAAALIAVFSITSVFALPPLAVCADIGTAQDVFISKTSGQACIDARADMSREFQIRIPVNITFNRNGALMADAGLMLAAYPFGNPGFFAGMTVVQFGYQIGRTQLKNRMCALNEITAGWTFRIKERLIIEPSVSFRDPSASFQDEYSAVRGIFPCYTAVRFHVMIGWQITKEKI